MAEDQFLQRYQNLNQQQQQAVDAIDGPVMVVAGPGSGKTELLSLRVANILRQQPDIAPTNILCLTYTEAGATNMRQRLVGLIGPQAYKVTINTFHGFSSEIINRYSEYFYNGAVLHPADDVTKLEILQHILDQLPHHDPLSGQFQGQHTYSKDINSAITDLKKAGLTPDQLSFILSKNQLMVQAVEADVQIFSDRITKSLIEPASQLAAKWLALSQADSEEPRLGQYPNLLSVWAATLNQAVVSCEALGKTSPLTDWKSTYLEKNDQGQLQFKEAKRLPKLLSLAHIYDQYRQDMAAHYFYDFDDMVLDVLTALANQPALAYALQEQYQYILVDEFQDTNDAQMQLLSYLTNAELHEGRPNIMVVGDDDQAIYKFQGATINNIQQFTSHYRQPQVIVLTDNYRSSQHILDLSRSVITLGQERLENLLPDLNKQLVAKGQHAQLQHQPQLNLYQTRQHEFVATAQHIKDHLDQVGLDKADQVAVICARRRDLEDFSAHLEQLGIPVRYDRQRNVLQQPHIHQLIQMARFISQLAQHHQPEADELLPEILSYPFWKLDRHHIWQLSIAASQAKKKSEQLWLWQMEVSEHPQLKAIAQWFMQLRLLSETESIEVMLENLIGAHVPLLPADEDSDDQEWIIDHQPVGFTSPFKEHYFPVEQGQIVNQADYISFLSSLQVFIGKLRQYRAGQPLKLSDLITFVDLHLANDLKITDTSIYASGQNAVQLLTAHGAKGLEFDHVYLLSCVHSVWHSKGMTNKISFSDNLPIATASDNHDDKLRLFFVALTRARQQLHLGAYQYQDDGKPAQALDYLSQALATQQIEAVDLPLTNPSQVLSQSWQAYHHTPITNHEHAMLWPLVENYQLSVTHLNDFLDVSRGGPQEFLQQHLLRFPQPKSASQSYGSAVHAALQQLSYRYRQDGVLPSIDFLQEQFTRALEAERLSPADYRLMLERGQTELELYYQTKSSTLHPNDIIEFNFANQQVMVGQAHLTGKIDRIVELSPGIVSVHDIKTGKPSPSWQGSTDYHKIKLDKYRRQLLFYKLLVESSRDFANKSQVSQGILEFIEPLHGRFIELPLELHQLQSELDQLQQLINIVFTHIKQLNFPDTTTYSADHKGVQQFIDDLLSQKI